MKRLIGVVPQRPNLDFALTAREILTFHGAYFGVPAAERTRRARDSARPVPAQRPRRSAHTGVFRGHAPEALDRSRPRARAGSPLPRRTERGPRSADSPPSVGPHPTRQRPRDHDPVDDAQHGGGRRAVLPRRDRRPRTRHRARHPAGAEELDSGRISRPAAPVAGAPPDLLAQFDRLPGVTEVRSPGSGAVDLYADRGGALVPEIARLSSEAGIEIRDVRISEPSLENLFLHHTGRSLRD